MISSLEPESKTWKEDFQITLDVGARGTACALLSIVRGVIPAATAARLHTDPAAFREFGPLLQQAFEQAVLSVVVKFGKEALDRVGTERLVEVFRDQFISGARAGADMDALVGTVSRS